MSDKTHLLAVDGDPVVQHALQTHFEALGFAVVCVDAGEKAFNALDRQPYEVVITELRTPLVDGGRVMALALDRNPHACVVVTTARPDIEAATAAMRRGAHDFQVKPLNLEKLAVVVERGLMIQALVRERTSLRRRLDERFGLQGFVGQSRQMAAVYAAVRQAAPGEDPVFIHGEPGSGKDFIAQAIHNGSPRRDGPFVKFRCGGVSPAVAARELFGGGRGRPVAGRFELADGGTLYLDGLESLPMKVQRRVLRYLREGQIERGERGAVLRPSVRLVASAPSRADVLAEDKVLDPQLARAFGAVSIEAPPLRARLEDLPPTAAHFLAEHALQSGTVRREAGPDALEALRSYPWPGNLRELRNVLGAAADAGDATRPLGAADVPGYLRAREEVSGEVMQIRVGTPMHGVERVAIERTLRHCGGDKEKCAKTLGIGLRTLYRKLKQYETGD